MKKFLVLILAMGGALGAAGSLLAQERPMGPPLVLQIFREEVKYGKGTAHEKNEAAFVAAFKRAKWPTTYLAAASLTGPAEAWFLTGYDSFEAWEKDNMAGEKATALQAELAQLGEKDAEYVSNGRSIVLFHRADLDNNATVNIGQMRYFRIATYRVRPGHEPDFVEAAKTVRAAYEKLGVAVHWAVYQVSSGMPSPTFLVFVPTKSLKEIDEGLARTMAFQEALGEENGKKLQKMATEGYLSTESNIFAFSPKMSYPPKAWVDADPDFWAPKPKAAAKAAAAEGAAKPAAPAKKEAAKAPKKQQ
jgi:hypothetical protein